MDNTLSPVVSVTVPTIAISNNELELILLEAVQYNLNKRKSYKPNSYTFITINKRIDELHQHLKSISN